jgi:hypothetical protein
MTMRTKYIATFIAAVVSLTAQAQEFSADTVTHDSSGRIFRTKLYRSATMIRAGADAASSNDGDPTFIIVDIPKQVSNTVMPNRKAIMAAHGMAALNKAGIALPINENPCTPTSGGPPSTRTSCRNLGEETVNRRHTVEWGVSETMRGQSGTSMSGWMQNCIASSKCRWGSPPWNTRTSGKGHSRPAYLPCLLATK